MFSANRYLRLPLDPNYLAGFPTGCDWQRTGRKWYKASVLIKKRRENKLSMLCGEGSFLLPQTLLLFILKTEFVVRLYDCCAVCHPTLNCKKCNLLNQMTFFFLLGGGCHLLFNSFLLILLPGYGISCHLTLRVLLLFLFLNLDLTLDLYSFKLWISNCFIFDFMKILYFMFVLYSTLVSVS